MTGQIMADIAMVLYDAIWYFMMRTIAVCFLVILGIASYRTLAHPLAGIPGPKFAALTNIWLAYQVRNGQSAAIGRDLHRKYGCMVRVGPNEVWFDSKDAFRAIYSKPPAQQVV